MYPFTVDMACVFSSKVKFFIFMPEFDESIFCPAQWLGNRRCRFRVWAPLRKRMVLHLVDGHRKVEMSRDDQGYFSVVAENVGPGAKYFFIPDGEKDLPDPASNFQPEGVHGPSQVVDHDAFQWSDQRWKGLPFRDLFIYELHTGTFTHEGTFQAIIPRLKDLADTGINAIELMPVAQFPGKRNWGYDGVFPYAVQNSYGGPDGLKRLVNACHEAGIAVILDVVYNHLGPEGNYFNEYAPYFTDRYNTPWGDAINFDGEWSDGVRDYFSDNALYWLHHFHIDGLRLDAIHMVFDNGSRHFWNYLTEKVKDLEQRAGRSLYLIAESDLNSPRVVNSPAVGGYGFTAQWLDDFHHALYVLLDNKGKDRYEDFGSIGQLAKAFKDGFVHSGDYVKFRKRKFGVSSAGIRGDKFVVFVSNHDQVGNRPGGERLSVLVNFEQLKLAAAALVCSACIPMFFMGDEYGEEAPFYYFIDHSDPSLIEAVRKGRKEEFKDFHTSGSSPDPQAQATFDRSVLRWEDRHTSRHALLLAWHRALIGLRKNTPALRNTDKDRLGVSTYHQAALVIYRQDARLQSHGLCLFNFSNHEVKIPTPLHGEAWKKVIASKDVEWMMDKSSAASMPMTVQPGQSLSLPPLAFAYYSD